MDNKEKITYYYSHPLSWVSTLLAVMISWFLNKSVLWAIFHGLFSGFYLIYAVLSGKLADGKFMEMIHHYF